MKCPHCTVAFNVDWETETIYADPDFAKTKRGKGVSHTQCPDCDRVVVVLVSGPCIEKRGDYGSYYELVDSDQEEVIYPKATIRPLPTEVPPGFAAEFAEAQAVLSASAKASAALSRRTLQRVLREHFGIKKPTLDKEIEEFLALPGLPTYLSTAVDAVRNVGNFAAHPLKDTNTGEIGDVEPGEAEWLTEVLESLFDYTFVQPRKLEARKQALNDKLKNLGKPPMKSTTKGSLGP